jgi:hypothetical protein
LESSITGTPVEGLEEMCEAMNDQANELFEDLVESVFGSETKITKDLFVR